MDKRILATTKSQITWSFHWLHQDFAIIATDYKKHKDLTAASNPVEHQSYSCGTCPWKWVH